MSHFLYVFGASKFIGATNMTQKEIIDKVHGQMYEPMLLSEVIHRIAKVILQESEKDGKKFLSRLEPATSAYAHAYPDDISDGPWDI